MPKFPKLSQTLTNPAGPRSCMNCGANGFCLIWREHDDLDQPTETLISLCEDCGKIIEPHPRLYARLDVYQPIPGTMDICKDCIHRDGLICQNPLQKRLGGSGLPVQFPKPSVMFIDGKTGGKRWGRQEQVFRPGEITCQGRETAGVGQDKDGASGMSEVYVDCEIREGLVSRQRAVYIPLSVGGIAEVMVHESLVHGGRMKARAVSWMDRQVLIELPCETSVGAWRLWVHRDSVHDAPATEPQKEVKS